MPEKPKIDFKDLEVVILCGGRGLRLSPITDEIPKPMVYVKQQPMLKHILDFFHRFGIHRFYLCLGYKGYMIKDYFSGKSLPYRITFDEAGEDASMLQRVMSVKKKLGGDRFVLAYGDALADIDLPALLKFHSQNHSLLTMSAMRLHSAFGILKVDPDGLAFDFKEKPLLEDWVNIGFMVVEKSILRSIPSGWSIIDLYQSLARQGRLFAFRYRGTHLTFNTREEKSDTEAKIDGFYTVLNNTLEQKNEE